MAFFTTYWMTAADAFEQLGGWSALGPYVVALVILLIGYIIAKSLARGVHSIARQTGTQHGATVAQKLVYYFVFVLAVILALSHLGIQIGTLLAAAGIFTVALGFAAQTSVSNVISGFFLLFDRPFSINDTVKIDATWGTIVSIELLSTRIRTFDNLMVRIPNETVLKSTIINYSLFDVRRIDITVSVAYGSNLNQAREVLQQIMSAHPLIFDEPRPVVLVDSLADDGVVFTVRAWVERTDFITAKSELTSAIHDALLAADINIPFPQRDVHFHPPADWTPTIVVTSSESHDRTDHEDALHTKSSSEPSLENQNSL